MKKKILLPVLTVCVLLSACHHDNPLKTESRTKSASFLVGASAVAERSLKLGIPEGSQGGVYTDCMEGIAETVDCQALYKSMVAFAKTGKYPAFKSLALADLTDKTVFASIRDRFEEVLLTTELED